MDADGPEAPGGRRVENLVWDEQVRYRRPAQAVIQSANIACNSIRNWPRSTTRR